MPWHSLAASVAPAGCRLDAAVLFARRGAPRLQEALAFKKGLGLES